MSDASANACADACADTIADDVADGCTYAGSNFGPDVESDERAECVADTESHICAHAVTDTVADAAAAYSLCAESVWQMGNVLKDVRRRSAVADKIHRDGAGARRQRLRRVDLRAPVQ